MRQEYKISNNKNNQFQFKDSHHTVCKHTPVFAEISVKYCIRGGLTQRQRITIEEEIGKK